MAGVEQWLLRLADCNIEAAAQFCNDHQPLPRRLPQVQNWRIRAQADMLAKSAPKLY
jgi:hypothetical protein